MTAVAGPTPRITENDPDAVGLPVQVPPANPRTGRPEGWSTPRRLRAPALAAALLAVVFGCTAVTGVTGLRAGSREIAHRAGPRLTVTTELRAVLGDLDASTAAIVRGGSGPAWQAARDASIESYERQRVQAAAQLYRLVAATDGEPRAAELARGLLSDFGRYQELIGQAMALGDRPLGAQSRQRDASVLMSTSLFAPLERLAGMDRDRIGAAAGNGRTVAALTTWGAVAAGALLLGTLAALQVMLSRRLRRRVNPWLAVATLTVLLLVPLTVSLLASGAADLREAGSAAAGPTMAVSAEVAERVPLVWAAIPPAGAAAVVLLVWLGLRPRLAEYR
ncbi:hypothetical protein [Spirillospora sp. NPDC047279]|uniref:hypothetical protein n=1 Tax=Spirillospora sp. NPDC047279 TaxID=3155478 RepID=UPI00340B9924